MLAQIHGYLPLKNDSSQCGWSSNAMATLTIVLRWLYEECRHDWRRMIWYELSILLVESWYEMEKGPRLTSIFATCNVESVSKLHR